MPICLIKKKMRHSRMDFISSAQYLNKGKQQVNIWAYPEKKTINK